MSLLCLEGSPTPTGVQCLGRSPESFTPQVEVVDTSRVGRTHTTNVLESGLGESVGTRGRGRRVRRQVSWVLRSTRVKRDKLRRETGGSDHL